jgi:hypothetical protein
MMLAGELYTVSAPEIQADRAQTARIKAAIPLELGDMSRTVTGMHILTANLPRAGQFDN